MSLTQTFSSSVTKPKTEDYRKLAELSAKVWCEAGALSYVEVEADDVKPGTRTSFPQAVDLNDGEFVVVALITYRSRAHRDDVNAPMKDRAWPAWTRRRCRSMASACSGAASSRSSGLYRVRSKPFHARNTI